VAVEVVPGQIKQVATVALVVVELARELLV
jgi:hypothetical protein